MQSRYDCDVAAQYCHTIAALLRSLIVAIHSAILQINKNAKLKIVGAVDTIAIRLVYYHHTLAKRSLCARHFVAM